MITQEQLKANIHYDPNTGIFTRIKTGDIAGFINKSIGYCQISVKNKQYYGHRLAFLYMTGSIPKYVDHIDSNRSNNKWVNLRAATKQQNSANVLLQKNNTHGYKGITKDSRDLPKRWIARIKVNYKPIRLGYFKTAKEAAIAYDLAAIKYFGEFAQLNFPRENYV